MLEDRDTKEPISSRPAPWCVAWVTGFYLLFVAVEVVDWRFELDGLDHFPRAERVEVSAAVGRVCSEKKRTRSISRKALCYFCNA